MRFDRIRQEVRIPLDPDPPHYAKYGSYQDPKIVAGEYDSVRDKAIIFV